MTTDQERAAAAIRANPEPHHEGARHLDASDFDERDSHWGAALVGLSVLAFIVSLVLL